MLKAKDIPDDITGQLMFEETERLTIQFLDGTRVDSRFADDVSMAWGTKDELGFKSIGFEKIVDTSQIESITFGIRISTAKRIIRSFGRRRAEQKCYSLSFID